MSVATPDRFCPYCGATNPPGYNFCQQCHRALPGTDPPSPGPPSTPPDSFQLVTAQRSGSSTTISVGRGAAGLLFMYIGIPLILVGIFLLIGASVAAQGAATFNQACSMNSLCTPAPDPSGALAAGGVLVLLIGILLAAYGFSQYRSQDS